jgi:hypothetical protein
MSLISVEEPQEHIDSLLDPEEAAVHEGEKKQPQFNR